MTIKTALGHVRVLDLTRVLAGPWCAQNLADMGADVIKIERPGSGDDTRSWGPPYLRDEAGDETSEATYYLAANRGKRSVTLDISRPAGQAVLRDLVQHCDVLIENYKVGQLAKYGLDYASLRSVRPDLIYCSITGFGQDGPYAPRAGYDFIVQGLGGFMSITGEADALPGGGPQKAGIAISDLMTGMYATTAILSALVHRDRTGEGQYIDMALLDVQVAMLANMSTCYLAGGGTPVRWGNAHPSIVPYQTFAVADGHLIIAVGNDAQFRRLVEAGGQPGLGTDPRFASNPARLRHRAQLVPMLQDMLRQHGKSEWMARLEAAGVPCGPINDLEDVFADPQVQARDMVHELTHPTAGHVRLVGSPMKMSATPPRYDRAPPLLGEHTQEILATWLGYGQEQIGALRRDGDI